MSAREKAIAAADRVLLAAEVGAAENVPADTAEAIIDAIEPILTAEMHERIYGPGGLLVRLTAAEAVCEAWEALGLSFGMAIGGTQWMDGPRLPLLSAGSLPVLRGAAVKLNKARSRWRAAKAEEVQS